MAADVALALPADESVRILAQPTPLAAFWATFRENRGAVFGLTVVGAVILAIWPGVGNESENADGYYPPP